MRALVCVERAQQQHDVRHVLPLDGRERLHRAEAGGGEGEELGEGRAHAQVARHVVRVRLRHHVVARREAHHAAQAVRTQHDERQRARRACGRERAQRGLGQLRGDDEAEVVEEGRVRREHRLDAVVHVRAAHVLVQLLQQCRHALRARLAEVRVLEEEVVAEVARGDGLAVHHCERADACRRRTHKRPRQRSAGSRTRVRTACERPSEHNVRRGACACRRGASGAGRTGQDKVFECLRAGRAAVHKAERAPLQRVLPMLAPHPARPVFARAARCAPQDGVSGTVATRGAREQRCRSVAHAPELPVITLLLVRIVEHAERGETRSTGGSAQGLTSAWRKATGQVLRTVLLINYGGKVQRLSNY